MRNDMGGRKGDSYNWRKKHLFEGCSSGQCNKQLSSPTSSPVTIRSSEIQSDCVTVPDKSEWLME